MKYVLYIIPNCQECTKIKSFLDSKRINYEEVNAGIGEGKERFRDLFRNHREQIERDDQGQIILPILVGDSNILQGLEKITSSL